MYSNYRLKLFLALLFFAIVVTTTIATIDYLRMKDKILGDIQNQIEQASESATAALYTIEKVYYLLDEQFEPEMEKNTFTLLQKYEQNDRFETWDFATLAEELGMDIYIINDENVIEYSNVPEEVGLDFKQCCKTLSKTLHERRKSGQLFIDGIDINQMNDEVKKFSYMATPDKKYLIELGYSLKNETIYRHFNFLSVIDELIERSDIISAIHILNYGGNAYGGSKDDIVPEERRELFEKVRETNATVESEGTYKGEEVILRYVPYHSPYDKGVTSFKVVEIIYNKKALLPFLKSNFHNYITQLIIVIIFTLVVSSLIANWFSKPVYYAYHDSLTKLKNRAAFDESLDKLIEEANGKCALYVLDIDNFKLVNDHLGHCEGDELLKAVGRKLKKITDYDGKAFRLGGDEFAIVLKYENQKEVSNIATMVIDELNETIAKNPKLEQYSVSVSIGVALAHQFMNKKLLYEQADYALYDAKKKGKNQYQIYNKLKQKTV